jgi:acyl-CoA synthetase (AMP-forming)/AMP-acid ligase II
MPLQERLAAHRLALRSALFRAGTLLRVGRQKGIHRAIHRSGIRFVLGELRNWKMNPSTLMRFLAANEPHKVALVRPDALLSPGSPDRVWSFFEMNERVDRIAQGLKARGVGRGGAVLLMLKNRPEFLLVQQAAGRVGAAAVSASWRSTVPELLYLAKNSGSRALFFDADVAEVVRSARSALEETIPAGSFFAIGGAAAGFPSLDDLTASAAVAAGAVESAESEDAAIVMYTSGTTGKPKGAVRKFTPEGTAAVFAFLGETPLELGDRHLAVCPLYHATAFGFIAFTYVLGGSVVVLPEFQPELVLEAIERYRINTTALVPTMIQRIADLGRERVRRHDLSSLRAIFSGGAPLSAPLALQAMEVLGDKLYNFYGATEIGVVTLAGPEDLRASPGTIGRLVPGNEVRVLDERGRECKEGEVGELWVRSPGVIEGYHGDAQGTQEAMLDGYFSVGDLVRRDARGCFHIEGRKRDMIISGGVNVYPAEVEAALDAHPAVAESAVIGVPDRDLGERVRAFVALRAGAALGAEELRVYCKQRLSGPKVPREFTFLAALPRNPTGKVLKRELREGTG